MIRGHGQRVLGALLGVAYVSWRLWAYDILGVAFGLLCLLSLLVLSIDEDRLPLSRKRSLLLLTLAFLVVAGVQGYSCVRS